MVGARKPETQGVAVSTTGTRRPRRSFGKIRKLPSGKFQASYMGPDLDRHNAPTTFETRGDANAYLSIMESRIIKGKWNPADDVVQDQTLAGTPIRGLLIVISSRALACYIAICWIRASCQRLGANLW